MFKAWASPWGPVPSKLEFGWWYKAVHSRSSIGSRREIMVCGG